MAHTVIFVKHLAAMNESSGKLISQWDRLTRFVVYRRVRISAALFCLLVALDVRNGLRPLDISDIGHPAAMLGLGFVIGGLLLRSWAAGVLQKKTEVTTRGPYAAVRHPLYLGSFLMVLGFCILIGDRQNFWFALPLLALLYAILIREEERGMADKFDEWQAYQRSVPAMVPYRLPRNLLSAWDFGQWVKNREYRTVAGVLMGLGAIKIWQVWMEMEPSG